MDAHRDTGKEAVQRQANVKRRMVTPIDYVLGVAFAITLGFCGLEYQRDNIRAAIWWGFACWICAGAGLTSLLLARDAERRSIEAKERVRAEAEAALAEQREALRAWVTVTKVEFGPRAHLMDMPAAVVSFQYDHTAMYQPDTQRFNVYPASGYNYSK